ncbi:Cyclopentanone 1,2-monooxygenase (CPMO), partial [Linnemannia exigua]
ASGLTAVKECLNEKGLVNVVAFEQMSYLNGLWHYVEYAQHFDLRRRIRFSTNVVEVKELHDEQKRWSVRFHPIRPATADASANITHTPEIQEEIFDYVMMCSDHHWKPRYPSFPGMDTSDPKANTGEKQHLHFYRQTDAFRDKTVVVVVFGNSAVELSLI